MVCCRTGRPPVSPFPTARPPGAVREDLVTERGADPGPCPAVLPTCDRWPKACQHYHGTKTRNAVYTDAQSSSWRYSYLQAVFDCLWQCIWTPVVSIQEGHPVISRVPKEPEKRVKHALGWVRLHTATPCACSLRRYFRFHLTAPQGSQPARESAIRSDRNGVYGSRRVSLNEHIGGTLSELFLRQPELDSPTARNCHSEELG